MDEKSFHIGQLIARQLQQELSEQERQELDAWRMAAPENEALWEELSATGFVSAALDRFYSYDQVTSRAKIDQVFNGWTRPRRIPPFRRWLVAAAVVLLIGAGLFLVVNHGSRRSPVPGQVHDIAAPAINQATITLANGQKVLLDSAGNGTLAVQGAVKVIKGEDGKVSYEGGNQGADATAGVVNTLYNPRGSRIISLALSDGTKVWLNAESSLTYPVVFTGQQRKVTISGEAYFEVTHETSKPFMVTKGDNEVTVLGTHFNVNAYEDEDAIRVTLLEGSVKVSQLAIHESRLISPGQQVSISQQSDAPSLHVQEDVDLDKVMAWKNGIFNFDQENITGIMLQLRRWYNADILYEGDKPTDLFSGIIKRDNNISRVLKLFEQTKRVHFKIDGQKVTVMK